MSVFDLRGPQFLVFYVALIALTSVALVLSRRVLESGPAPKLSSVDPYLVACLRGGPAEAIRVATLALVDRGLIEVRDEQLVAIEHAAAQVRRPIERAILAALSVPRPAFELVTNPSVLASTSYLHTELVELGLFPTASDKQRRLLLGAFAVLGLWTVAAVKLRLAFLRGRPNIQFLVLLALVSVVVVALVLAQRRTRRGDLLLGDLRILFERLRGRRDAIEAGGGTQELALLAAVFGLTALDGPQLLLAHQLFPKAAASGSSGGSGFGSSSSCGSSCSSASSCGSSCGGGCGGGGCGGCGS